jgi:hypothetical protein
VSRLYVSILRSKDGTSFKFHGPWHAVLALAALLMIGIGVIAWLFRSNVGQLLTLL